VYSLRCSRTLCIQILHISFRLVKRIEGRIASGPEAKPLGVRRGEKWEMFRSLDTFPWVHRRQGTSRGLRADVRVATHGAYPHFAVYGHVLAFVDVLLRFE